MILQKKKTLNFQVSKITLANIKNLILGVTTIRRDKSATRKKTALSPFNASTIKKNFSLSKADKKDIPRVVKRRQSSEEMTISEFTKSPQNFELDTDFEDEIMEDKSKGVI